jgi:hypothetical protein
MAIVAYVVTGAITALGPVADIQHSANGPVKRTTFFRV